MLKGGMGFMVLVENRAVGLWKQGEIGKTPTLGAGLSIWVGLQDTFPQ